MTPHLGTTLPPRGLFVWAGLACAALFLWPVVVMARSALRSEGLPATLGWAAAAAGVGALLVVLPLWFAWFFAGMRFHVSEDRVTRTSRGEVTQQIAWAEVTEVKVRREGNLFGTGAEHGNPAVTLLAPAAGGRTERMHVASTVVSDLRPLLERLAEEAGLRPSILADDERRRLEEVLGRPVA